MARRPRAPPAARARGQVRGPQVQRPSAEALPGPGAPTAAPGHGHPIPATSGGHRQGLCLHGQTFPAACLGEMFVTLTMYRLRCRDWARGPRPLPQLARSKAPPRRLASSTSWAGFLLGSPAWAPPLPALASVTHPLGQGPGAPLQVGSGGLAPPSAGCAHLAGGAAQENCPAPPCRTSHIIHLCPLCPFPSGCCHPFPGGTPAEALSGGHAGSQRCPPIQPPERAPAPRPPLGLCDPRLPPAELGRQGGDFWSGQAGP